MTWSALLDWLFWPVYFYLFVYGQFLFVCLRSLEVTGNKDAFLLEGLGGLRQTWEHSRITASLFFLLTFLAMTIFNAVLLMGTPFSLVSWLIGVCATGLIELLLFRKRIALANSFLLRWQLSGKALQDRFGLMYVYAFGPPIMYLVLSLTYIFPS